MKKLTKKELEQQASEFGCSVEEIKELRKHILPFLGFAIDFLSLPLDSKKRINFLGYRVYWICGILPFYCDINSKTYDYLRYRLKAAKPSDVGVEEIIWWYYELQCDTLEGQQKRIEWCKL